MQFVSRHEAWAIGFGPPGETGEGDFSILHTRDGGKIWTEIPASYQHNEAPSVSFADQREGWVMILDIGAAEERLLQTHDGGRHWRRLRLPASFWFVTNIQYLGAGVGFADSFDNYKKRGSLLETTDYGRHWRKLELPTGFQPEKMQFVSARRGLIVGCLNHAVVILRTSDGGRRWRQALTSAPADPPLTNDYCIFLPDDLSLLDSRRGWLLISKHDFMTGDLTAIAFLSKTIDGGATWVRTFQETSPLADEEWFTSVKFLSGQLGFMTKTKRSNGSQDSNGDAKGALLYTTDGGGVWRQIDLPRSASGCVQYRRELTCAAGDDGFWVLRIMPTGAH